MKRTVKFYRIIFLRHDLPAGISVFLVALPLCLGIALASGAPVYAGLLSGIIGGLVVSLISGSQLAVSGPTAGLTTVVVASMDYDILEIISKFENKAHDRHIELHLLGIEKVNVTAIH